MGLVPFSFYLLFTVDSNKIQRVVEKTEA
jgi:hypothetical protein